MIIRTFSGAVHVREINGRKLIAGTAIVFDQWSLDLGGFIERVAPGALDWSLANRDIKLLHGHDARFVLGSTQSGTLRLVLTAGGLDFEVDAPDTQWARDLLVSVERGDIAGCSFGFDYRKNGVRYERDAEGERVTLVDIDLREISITAFPAYPQTQVSIRDYLQAAGMGESQIRECIEGHARAQQPGADSSPTVQQPDHRRRYLDLLEAAWWRGDKPLPIQKERTLQCD